MQLLDGLLAAAKLPPKVMIPVCMLCATVVFCPAPLLQQLGLGKLEAQYRPWFGFGFLGSALILLTHWFFSIKSTIVNIMYERHKARKRLHHLTFEERIILQKYLYHGRRTINFGIDNGVVASLVVNGILFQSSGFGSIVGGFAFDISDDVFQYLQKHPELLSTPPESTIRRL